MPKQFNIINKCFKTTPCGNMRYIEKFTNADDTLKKGFHEFKMRIPGMDKEQTLIKANNGLIYNDYGNYWVEISDIHYELTGRRGFEFIKKIYEYARNITF